jgi:hypothetical protein
MKTHQAEYFPHLSTVSSPGGVHGERKSGDYIKHDSDTQIQQEIRRTDILDFLKKRRK